jgi:uncharacterized RDD family membrane protein YckC
VNVLEPVRAETPQPLPHYAGLVTRATAFAIDAALLTGFAAVVVGGIQLSLSLFNLSLSDLPDWLKAVLGVGSWVGLNLAYFVGSWALTGQTAGMRVMSIRVESVNGGRLSAWRGVARLVGLFLAAVPFMAGYLPILVSDRRRGLQDWLGGSVVVFRSERSLTWGGPVRRRMVRERRQLPSPRATSPRTGDAGQAEQA